MFILGSILLGFSVVVFVYALTLVISHNRKWRRKEDAGFLTFITMITAAAVILISLVIASACFQEAGWKAFGPWEYTDLQEEFTVLETLDHGFAWVENNEDKRQCIAWITGETIDEIIACEGDRDG